MMTVSDALRRANDKLDEVLPGLLDCARKELEVQGLDECTLGKNLLIFEIGIRQDFINGMLRVMREHLQEGLEWHEVTMPHDAVKH
jgi:hypothetical protein